MTDFKDDGTRFSGVQAVTARITGGERGIQETTFDGRKLYFVYAPVADLGATLALGVPASQIDAPLQRLVRIHALIIALSILGLVLLIPPLTRSITRPIEQLVEVSFRSLSPTCATWRARPKP
jgi:hypothetical protein